MKECKKRQNVLMKWIKTLIKLPLISQNNKAKSLATDCINELFAEKSRRKSGPACPRHTPCLRNVFASSFKA